MLNPYQTLPDKAFWKLAVSNRNLFDIIDLYEPKFNITSNSKIITFGSCFAQHIGKALKRNGYNWYITESKPTWFSIDQTKTFNYDIFTCRTGNIYTTSLLKQWVKWSIGNIQSPNELWHINNRFYDPFRPNIEPNGFYSYQEAMNSRLQTICSFKRALLDADIFIFTMGLTESWWNKTENYEYPMCPGTVVGDFNNHKHLFMNQDYEFIKQELLEAINLIRKVNKNIKFILTISPVPLTATNSGSHVLVATSESKSILRAVAASLKNTYSAVIDYFPSYEIINSPVFKGIFFEPNMRNVHPQGVKFVMKSFFDKIKNEKKILSDEKKQKTKNNDVVCEEELLNAFK